MLTSEILTLDPRVGPEGRKLGQKGPEEKIQSLPLFDSLSTIGDEMKRRGNEWKHHKGTHLSRPIPYQANERLEQSVGLSDVVL